MIRSYERKSKNGDGTTITNQYVILLCYRNLEMHTDATTSQPIIYLFERTVASRGIGWNTHFLACTYSTLLLTTMETTAASPLATLGTLASSATLGTLASSATLGTFARFAFGSLALFA